MNSLTSQSLSQEQGITFFRNLIRNLNEIPMWRIVSLVRVIMSRLRESHPAEQLNETLTNALKFFN